MNSFMTPEQAAKDIFYVIEEIAKELPKEKRQEYYKAVCGSIQSDLGGFPNDTCTSKKP